MELHRTISRAVFLTVQYGEAQSLGVHRDIKVFVISRCEANWLLKKETLHILPSIWHSRSFCGDHKIKAFSFTETFWASKVFNSLDRSILEKPPMMVFGAYWCNNSGAFGELDFGNKTNGNRKKMEIMMFGSSFTKIVKKAIIFRKRFGSSTFQTLKSFGFEIQSQLFLKNSLSQ